MNSSRASDALPLWAEWLFGWSTVVLGVATVVLAMAAIRLAVRSTAAATQSKAISEWQRHDQEVTNFKRRLEQRIGHAHAVLGLKALGVVALQLPPSPGEPADEREARRQQAPAHGFDSDDDFESLMFTMLPGEGCSLEMLWGTYRHLEDAFVHAAAKYQLPVGRPPADPDAKALWSVGPTYMLVTRRAGEGIAG